MTVNGMGTSWNLPNYAGELFTASVTDTPFLSMIGGLSGGKMTNDYEFATGVLYDYPEPTQPAISEKASLTAPEATAITRKQEKNVTQIFHEVVALSYVKQSNMGRLQGLNSAGQQANPLNEKAWQIQKRLVKIARDVEHTFLNGTYALATSDAEPNKTRGMIELCKSEAGTNINANGAAMSDTLLKTLTRMMADNGAEFANTVLFANSYQKQAITEAFQKQLGFGLPASRNVGGVAIHEFETDFCKLGIVWNRFLPADTILVADVAHIAPVFQVVPDKGVLFEEPLAKDGASDKIQIFGQIGLDHAPAFLHGCIYGLATESV